MARPGQHLLTAHCAHLPWLADYDPLRLDDGGVPGEAAGVSDWMPGANSRAVSLALALDPSQVSLSPGDRDQAAGAEGLLTDLQDDAHLPPFVFGAPKSKVAAIRLDETLHRRTNL